MLIKHMFYTKMGKNGNESLSTVPKICFFFANDSKHAYIIESIQGLLVVHALYKS